ncbi:cbb3-type cytochrome c oxidase subunit I [Sphingomonas sabuli]|uniref:Cbb3-type cytochrome c oxidase subunit I n=1 Tax=Sphingomonas sabuli TaxID=2764186 RepID=A0A7G9KZS4_9SPHN|nr:cbb3-type cytochrome c oxidase subunit I [Sphingomonas sabuli]QNM81873.1 cbb3-type cytochrome c oxidase subunit I [Sphingomonas sabuli]
MTSETGFDPALLDRFPTSGKRPDGELEQLEKIWCAPRGWQYFAAVNNNYIGLYYVATAFLFFLLAGVLALVMRVQLAAPLQSILSPETYNQFFTMHGTVMMFLFAVPMVEAIGILLLPQMLAARDLPFPRLSAYAFWAYLVGGLAFFASLFVGLAPDGGWFMYPPLTSTAYSPGINTDFWLLGIGFIEISAIAGAVEIIVGVMRTRAPGMTLDRMPIFAWAMLVFAVMIIVAFPSVIVGTLLLELERAFNWPFFDPLRGGDPLLWQHLFWFFGHPEVYIIFLPAAGLTSMMVATIAKSELVGHRLVVMAMVGTGFLSFGVWAHHMFSVGMPRVSTSMFSAASMAVSIPAGVQLFAWIATLASGRIRWSTPALFTLGAMFIFTIGGLTGVMVAFVPFDWQAHDTYFIVAHLHYVLMGGMVFPMFAAFYFWTPMVSRRPLSESIGKWVFGLMFAGLHLAFFPMHLSGLLGMPRRVFTYLPSSPLDLLNLMSTLGAFLFASAVALFLVDLVRSFRWAPAEGSAGNTFDSGTLEWLPSGLYSTRSIPVVRSRYPLWDDPDMARHVEAGRYLLPNSATGLRETIVTSPVQAEPQYVEIMPGPSPWPFWAAVSTAVFFLSLTVQAYAVAAGAAIVMILSTMRWLWETDRPIRQQTADVGAGIMLPTYATGRDSHGWWALNILFVVMAMMLFILVFSIAYLRGVHPEGWIPTQSWWPLAAIFGLNGIAAALAVGGQALLRRWPEGARSVWFLLAIAPVALAIGTWMDASAWQAAGLAPTASGQGATTFAMIAQQATAVGFALLMGMYAIARGGRGLLVGPRSATVDVIARFMVFTALQGSIVAAASRLVAIS